jgi:hypothetical protein
MMFRHGTQANGKRVTRHELFWTHAPLPNRSRLWEGGDADARCSPSGGSLGYSTAIPVLE